MIKRRQLELAFETLRITISFRLSTSEKRLDTLTQARFTVEGNHLVFQVKNATAVRYTKRNGGYKPDD
jgi:ribosomal protein L17